MAPGEYLATVETEAGSEIVVEEVRLEIHNGTAHIVLSHPEKANCLTLDMADQIADICQSIDNNSSVGCTIVTGADGTFCSGADRQLLAAVGEDPSGSASFNQLGRIYDVFHRIRRLKVPTIAAIRGSAVGAGVNLMLSTDIRIVADDALIRPGFQRIGLHPGGGHLSLLGRAVSWEVCVAAGIFGAEFSGSEAAHFGMAWMCVADDMVMVSAQELAAVPAGDPELSRHAIHTLRTELSHPRISIDAASDLERSYQMWSLRRWMKTAATK